MTLEEVLAAAVDELDVPPDVEVTDDGSRIWSRDGVAFAELEGAVDSVAFRLDPTLAAAAVRTPDTVVTSRGNDWVVFAPGAIDGHAADRARSWFLAAYRRAGPPDTTDAPEG